MSVFLEFVGGIFAIVLLAVWIITIVDVFHSRLGAGRTAAWILIVLLLPFVGSILYWVLRKPSADEAQRLYDNERALHETAYRRPVDSGYFGP
jgi:predicted PurR-regulated permease PerM